MRIFKTLFAISILASLTTGCVDEYESDFMTDKTDEAALQQFLGQYDVLKNCLGDNQMSLGTNISLTDFLNKQTTYSLALSNFNQIAVVDGLSPVNLLDTLSGELNTIPVQNYVNEAMESGMTAFGPVICSYQNQQGDYLRGLIADIYVPGDHVEGSDVVEDFEGFTIGQSIPMTGGSSAVVEADPDNESGHTLHVGSSSNPASYSYPMISVTLPDGKTLGEYDKVNIDFRGTGSTGLYGSGMRMTINNKEQVVYGSPSSFGCPDGGWGRSSISLELANLNLSDEDKKLNSFTLVIGSGTGSGDYYIDNVTFYQDHDLPGTTIVKTPEEKAAIIDSCLNVWTAGLMDASQGVIKDWVIVEDPMSDADGEMLRQDANATTTQFYWNGVLGDNYVRNAVKHAREAAVDSSGKSMAVNLYVSEYGLDKGTKLSRLLQQIAQWEEDGTQIDGINVQLPLTFYTDESMQSDAENAIRTMLTKLASSGKLIRIDALSMKLVDDGSEVTQSAISQSQLFAMASYYNKVIQSYIELIPEAQRGGISFEPLEGSTTNSVGLWDTGYNRKITYSGVATGLSGTEAPTEDDLEK